jgi:hypothetical protein
MNEHNMNADTHMDMDTNLDTHKDMDTNRDTDIFKD